MFIVIELQVYNDGQVGHILSTHETFPDAQNKFYTICAFAAISEVPKHSAVILDEMGVMIDRKSFEHIIEIEPVEEPIVEEPIEESEGE